MQIRLGLVGADGRMGRAVLQSLRDPFSLAAAFVSPSNPLQGRTVRDAGLAPVDVPLVSQEHAAPAVAACDVLVSFATPSADVAFAALAAERGTPLVTGTTGHSAEDRTQLAIASGRIPLVLSPNFSMGIAALQRMIGGLPPLAEVFDAAVVETHHTRKRDAPSGTAKVLAETLERALSPRGNDGASQRIPISSIRAGGVPGDHEVILASTHEVLRIEHRVLTRSAFAQGALVAAEWAVRTDRPGLYSFLDVLGAN